ncbi:hypothetical protein EHP00_1038 [Ecytonucleospora hepatopenaei]|uniref:Uncharacterized protein n=1 Tax=Ecytonucleospora hepatopenaei TaxID=646526 RepID=A0A1W0E528_9MICR|nr:hypothetical protein EHP00_1038 [Ecytonucleospora hepatopenaei]
MLLFFYLFFNCIISSGHDRINIKNLIFKRMAKKVANAFKFNNRNQLSETEIDINVDVEKNLSEGFSSTNENVSETSSNSSVFPCQISFENEMSKNKMVRKRIVSISQNSLGESTLNSSTIENPSLPASPSSPNSPIASTPNNHKKSSRFSNLTNKSENESKEKNVFVFD